MADFSLASLVNSVYKFIRKNFMFSRFFVSMFILCFFSLNAAADSDNPFAKNESVDIGKGSSWKVDKKAVVATKTGGDSDGNFYHLQFNNKQIILAVSTDAAGNSPKSYSSLEVHDVQIDGVQNPVFNWCLNNQDKHNRFLQQGLSVKKNICVVNGGVGSFMMSLNNDALVSLQKGSTLTIEIKPYRTPLVLSFDISDFSNMYTALNAQPAPAPAAAVAAKTATSAPKKKCKVSAPVKYQNIQPMEYDCNNAAAKNAAEASVATLVSQEKAKEQKLAAEKEKQRKLAEEKKLAEQLKKQELLQAEAAALAASEAKQAQIGDEIADKMISMCQKYWDKGEHRCYCQKYIDRAPSEIQANSTCN